MARIRTIKPEIWLSHQVMNLSHGARLMFIGIITQADDEGRGSADPRRLKAAIFPADDVLSKHVDEWLDEIVKQGLVLTYHSDEHGPLYFLPTWKSHQKVDRPKPSRYPALKKQSTTDRRTIDEPSTKDREGSDRIGSEGSEGSDARAREAAGGASLRAIGDATDKWLRGGTA